MKIPITVQPNTDPTNKTGAWRTIKPNFLHDKCTACAICSRVCPEDIIYQTGKTNAAGKPYYQADLDYCKGCGLCAQECPFKAIVMVIDEK